MNNNLLSEHRVDSSSCNIYTAWWTPPLSEQAEQVVLKVMRADRYTVVHTRYIYR